MSLPNYQIVVLSAVDGSTLQVYDGTAFYSLIYNRPINDVGALAMTLPGSSELDELFQLDTFIEVLRASPITGQLAVEDTFLTRITQRFRQSNEERYVVGGVSLNHLIGRRVIDPADDPLAAGGYSTKAGAADSVMHDYALEQMGSSASALRQFPDFTIAAVPGVGASVGKRARYDNLLEVFQGLAEQGGMDFIISRVNDRNLRLNIGVIGTDRSKTTNYPFAPFMMMNPIRGNIADPSYTIDRKEEGNVCYALGQGQGESRITQVVTGEGFGDSPYNRIEFTEDVRLAERNSAAQLLTGARTALTARKPKQEFTFVPLATSPGSQYQDDFFIGDIVTAAWDDVEIDLRIRDVEIRIDESGEQLNIVSKTL